MNCKTKSGFLFFSKLCEEIIFNYCSIFPVECRQLELVAEMLGKWLCDKDLCVTIASDTVKRLVNHFGKNTNRPKSSLATPQKMNPL